ADRMAERLEPAARIDRHVTADRGPSLLDEPSALALRAEAEVLDVGYLGPRKAVVDLGEVDVARCDPGHCVRLARRGLGGAEAEVVEGGIEVRPAGRDGETRPLHEDGRLLEALREIGAADDRRRGAVGRRAAVEEPEGPRDDRRLQDLLGRDLALEMRLRVQRAVFVVLHRDLRERLAPEAER